MKQKKNIQQSIFFLLLSTEMEYSCWLHQRNKIRKVKTFNILIRNRDIVFKQVAFKGIFSLLHDGVKIKNVR